MAVRLLLTGLMVCASSGVIIAKAPDAPSMPEVEFRVLPPTAQEFFETGCQSNVSESRVELTTDAEQLKVMPRVVSE